MSSNGSRESSGSDDLNILSADNPLTDPDGDRLGYAPFAKNLADSICKMSPPDGFVMAVYAPWGSGKSTLLNFIVHYLDQEPEDIKPLIFRFNPWWFSGQEELTRQFFSEFIAFLQEEWQNLFDSLKSPLNDLAEIASKIPVGFDLIPFVKEVKVSGEAAKRIFGRDKTVYKLKKEIEKRLTEEDKRILVVIDDIDRLEPEEIRQLFRLLKAVANFPNTVYFLSFDKGVVIKNLEAIQRVSGEDYLEKIVQVPFELPLPDRDS
ncbi:MAG: P-loop NTPase fold protein [Spirulina sp.]